MTCSGCEAKVRKLLTGVEGVRAVTIDLAKGEAAVEMERHIPTDTLAAALKDHPKYQLSAGHRPTSVSGDDPAPSWFSTYKPILLLFGYISLLSVIAGSAGSAFDAKLAMRVFMSGFFLSFSFFKLLNLKGFAESYAMYDIVAGRIPAWGYVYAFIELGLGIAFAVNVVPVLTNWITLVVMTVSIIGVLKSVLNKRKIKCACLGAVFNLPMSTVTIIEDGLMIGMSAIALATAMV
jgi:copper chaperone CopZ